jgi:hypothetical protein
VQVDLLMTLGKASETVTVDAAPPALKTQEASVGQVIGQQAIIHSKTFFFVDTKARATGRYNFGALASCRCHGSERHEIFSNLMPLWLTIPTANPL